MGEGSPARLFPDRADGQPGLVNDQSRLAASGLPYPRSNGHRRNGTACYGDGVWPIAVAHRGGAGLAPENTLAAFARSYALGVRYLETDVRVTADGTCVTFHDADTHRLTGVRGPIASLSWTAVQRLRVLGRDPVPRLEEVLSTFPDARVALDLKDPRAIGPLVAAVRRCNAEDRICVAGSADRWLADVRAAFDGRVSTALGWESLVRLTTAAHLGLRPYDIVPAPFAHLPLRLGRIPVVTQRLIAMAHELGSRVLVWTVNTPHAMHRMLDAGADGIITDRPDVLREVLVTRGGWHPPTTSSAAGPSAFEGGTELVAPTSGTPYGGGMTPRRKGSRRRARAA